MLNLSAVPGIIASRLNTLLESRGLSRYELSQMTNVPYPTVKRITHPDTSTYPRLETIYAIADALGLSVDYLIGATDERIPKFDDDMNKLIKLYPLVTKEDREIIAMILRKYSE